MGTPAFGNDDRPMTPVENLLLLHYVQQKYRHCITMADLYPDNPRKPWFIHAAHMLNEISLLNSGGVHLRDVGHYDPRSGNRSVAAIRDILQAERAVRESRLPMLIEDVEDEMPDAAEEHSKITAEIAALSMVLMVTCSLVNDAEATTEMLRARTQADRDRARAAKEALLSA